MKINKIYFDIDETLIHTLLVEENPHVDYFDSREFGIPGLDGGTESYYVIGRPCATELIEHARKLVGHENVYILTAATRDYAQAVNEILAFGFDHNNILAREDMMETRIHHTANENNVIIDNMPIRYNYEKIQFIGLENTAHDNYVKVHDWYGRRDNADTIKEIFYEYFNTL